jgi:dienelactone hydrolase
MVTVKITSYLNCVVSIFLLSLNLFDSCLLFGQTGKIDLDTTSFSNWETANGPVISDDGKYFAYTSQHNEGGNTLHIKACSENWSKNIQHVSKYIFSHDNTKVYLIIGDDSLVSMRLGSNSYSFLAHTDNFDAIFKDKCEWIIYKNNNQDLILLNIGSLKKVVYKQVGSYILDKQFNFFYFIKKVGINFELSFAKFASSITRRIEVFNNVDNLITNDNGNLIAFRAESKPLKSTGRALWLFNNNSKQLEVLACEKEFDANSNITLESIDCFSENSKRLFFKLKELQSSVSFNFNSYQRVWSYMDPILKSYNVTDDYSIGVLASINLDNLKIDIIQEKNETITFFSDHFVALEQADGSNTERYWNKISVSKYFFYNCQTGKKIELSGVPAIHSQNKRFFLCLDSLRTNFNVYDISNNLYYPLTHQLNFFNNQIKLNENDRKSWIIEGWINASHVILFDGYDLWDFDIERRNKYVNLTSGYGREKNISFRIAIKEKDGFLSQSNISLLSAFNNTTKENGFFRIDISALKIPRKLVMSNHFYYYPEKGLLVSESPLKAKRADLWIVSRQSADSSPNFYFTKDFISFKCLSNTFPEKKYKWLTTELLSYKTLDDQVSQAILYKPSNFDPSKKYPVILCFYEEKSYLLNYFINPAFTYNNINIPWFVSKGYIICTPDIRYTKGAPGESALNSIVGATKYLCNLPFIDSAKIGLQGHSFGAYEVNYILAHSTLFRAAISAQGLSNLISASRSINLRDGLNIQGALAEAGQLRMSCPLWERPDLYVHNSPVIDANRIVTPLLIMANLMDGTVNADQGIQFFISLRKLGKPVWMIQYQGEKHTLMVHQNTVDYTEKILGFFDYYLKDFPSPKWMNTID